MRFRKAILDPPLQNDLVSISLKVGLAYNWRLIVGDEFRNRARTYLVNGLERGVPSLFVDVKGVYVEASKMEIVGEILEETIVSLEKDASLHDDGECC